MSGQGVELLGADEANEMLSGRVFLPLFGPDKVGTYSVGTRLEDATRRLADLLLAMTALALLLPVLAVVALAIVLDSPGSPLYFQERVGRFGRRFRLIKLRTMVRDAEPDGQATWTRDHDPRITRVGALLRRSRLDEAPQLWNVVRGEMSLVGPRPERPEFVALLTRQCPAYPTRHVIRPGITGWAQVKYRYGSSVQDALVKLQYDLYYVRHRSIVLDGLILIRTLPVVLRLKGV